MTDERGCDAGVDWASENLHVFLTDDNAVKLGERIFKHRGAGLAERAAWPTATAGSAKPAQVHVVIELPHGRSSRR